MTTPQTPGGSGDRVPQYVYGVVRSDAALPQDVAGLDDRPVSLVQDGGVCAAVVSDLPQGRALGERADLVAHQRVLNALVDAGTVVLPFRFGAALSDRDAVEKELLAGNSDRLGQVLDQLEGRVELRLKATYVQDAVLREIMTAEPEIAELSRRVREVPADAADAVYYDRVRLGELIAQAMDRRREVDGQVLLDGSAPAAEAFVRKSPAREEDVLDASFLVRADRRAEFEEAVDKLGQTHGDRIRIRLIGPLPPYDFVPEA
ncbi:GvpL/GvpF family gas vesicle protein [Actinomadura madurae]|uniref:Gas vesicle synthesis protein GvpL/GvpF n=1 Tax=Actinomadura madurae TaxID=1993 RepID=A0A1I5JVI0_9ACTN|nr:GvpL/GvpF family gas vesicle protein [Actinomadura madurae]SFO76777.1 Gas vesicle synthesis protein GvpL/GvpF [Actinomadura madurae]SPT64299.1 Gas vesicle synthesis protein GvpL/GvpF [Actinomadura madurae]